MEAFNHNEHKSEDWQGRIKWFQSLTSVVDWPTYKELHHLCGWIVNAPIPQL